MNLLKMPLLKRRGLLPYALVAGFTLVCALQITSLAVLMVAQQKQERSLRQMRETVYPAIRRQENLQNLFLELRTLWRSYLLTGNPELEAAFRRVYQDQLAPQLLAEHQIMRHIGPAVATALEDIRGTVAKYYYETLLPPLRQPLPLSKDDLDQVTEMSVSQALAVNRCFYALKKELEAAYTALELEIVHLNNIKLVGIGWLAVVSLAVTAYVGWISLRAVLFFRQAAEQRAAAERQGRFFKAVLDQLPAGVFVRSAPSGETVMVNRVARQVMEQARSPQSVTQATTEGVLHPDGAPYRTAELPIMRALTKSETVSSEEMVLEQAGGGRVTFLCSSTPILGDDGRIVAAITIFQDITERKKLESSLEAKTRELDRMVREQQQQIKRLTLLQEISAKVSAQTSAFDICREVLPTVAATMGVEKCCAMLTDPAGRELRVAVPAYGLSDAELAALPPLRIEGDTSAVARVFQEGTAAVFNDVERNAEAVPYREAFIKAGIRAAAFVSLAARGKPVGVLAVFNRRDGQPFSAQDVQLLRILAGPIAIAFDNARLYESLRERSDQLATLLQEAHHRIKNNLATVIGLLSLEMSYGLDKSAAEICASTISRIESIARAHALLTQESTRGVPMHPLLNELVQSVASSHLNPRQRIVVEKNIAPMYLPAREATALALVTSELVSNALRHGLAGRETGRVLVRLQQEGESEAVLEVTNDGHPLPQDFPQQRHGLGLRIVEALATRDLKGQFSVQSHDGQTTAKIRFRLPPNISELAAHIPPM